MTLKSLALSSAAVLALSFGAAQAGDDPYTHNSTPAEQAQTQDLNAQAQGQATSDNDSDQAAQQQYQDQQQQYQSQQQQYQNDQSRYQAQQDVYAAQQAEYYDRSHPYAWWHDRYTAATLNHFYDVPRAELIGLRVIREDGFTAGRISEVDKNPDGRVDSVKISLRNGDFAWVKARDLRYDPADRIVFTDLSIQEIRSMARNS
jgi:hypothetical protein